MATLTQPRVKTYLDGASTKTIYDASAMQACGSGRSFCKHVEPHLQPLSELWRYEVDLAARRVVGRRRLSEHVLEFPAVNPLYQGACLRWDLRFRGKS